ncbi:HD domain-containing phosphohydrolase [Persephonella sp.]
MEMDKKPVLLIVDDDPQSRILINIMCRKWGYSIIECSDGNEAIELAEKHRPDIIIMDVVMPGTDGLTAVGRLKESPETRHIPVVLMTGKEDRQIRIKGIELGADDFFTKPIDIHEFKLRLENSLKLKRYNDYLKNQNSFLQKELMEMVNEVKKAYLDSLYRLSKIAEYRDLETSNHLKRIGHFSKEMAFRLGMDREFVDNIYYASQMHDIGKVGIPEYILNKNGRLNPEEYEIMKNHTLIGADILKGSNIPVVQMAEEIAKYHHEKWNGEGYPEGLKGNQIPLPARIVALADIYDALRSRRSYKPPMDHETAVDIILNGDRRTRPEHFDPDVLNVFRKHHRIFEEIYETVRAYQ